MTMTQLLQLQLQAEQARRAYAVLTIVSTQGVTSRTEGKMLVFADGETAGTIGGGAVEMAAIADAREYIRHGGERLRTYGSCSGQMTVLLETFGQRPVLVVCGGGHVGRALMRIARPTGFEIILVDTRPAEQLDGAPELADRFCHVADFQQGMPGLKLPAGAYYVCCSFSHPSDLDAAAAALGASHAKAWGWSLALATLLALSRLYLYVHYPTDVLAGALVGILAGLAGAALARRLPPRRAKKEQLDVAD